MTVAVFDRLTDHMLAADAPLDREVWSIRDLDAAAWAARKLAAAHAEVAGIDAWLEREIARATAAADTERRRHQSEIEFFEGHLGRYLAGLVADGRKTKTLNLPAGSVSLRARQPLVEVDEPAALAWARVEAPDVVKVRESIDKAALKKRLEFAQGGYAVDTESGEVLPFVTWQPQTESITFTPAGEEPS
jgi:phage host-nuclease inhibitor protein Gam